jgi:hypothetical protein
MNHGTKFCRLCLKPLLPTILTSSFTFSPYQKDERALPGYLLTRCSFFPLRYKAPFAFPQMFSLFFYSYTILSDSLSLCSSSKGDALRSVKEGRGPAYFKTTLRLPSCIGHTLIDADTTCGRISYIDTRAATGLFTFSGTERHSRVVSTLDSYSEG